MALDCQAKVDGQKDTCRRVCDDWLSADWSWNNIKANFSSLSVTHQSDHFLSLLKRTFLKCPLRLCQTDHLRLCNISFVLICRRLLTDGRRCTIMCFVSQVCSGLSVWPITFFSFVQIGSKCRVIACSFGGWSLLWILTLLLERRLLLVTRFLLENSITETNIVFHHSCFSSACCYRYTTTSFRFRRFWSVVSCQINDADSLGWYRYCLPAIRTSQNIYMFIPVAMQQQM